MSILSELGEAIDALAALMEAPRRQYTYEEVTVKRWVLGSGGKSGNCELCEDNAAAGWVDQDDIFEGVFEDIDEPPAHPNCDCTLEIKDTRRRVYA